MFPKGPRDSQNWRILTLRELRSATCLVQTSLLAFHDTGVAGQHAGLLQGGFLTRDPRMKERKKYGLKAARRAPQFSKR